MRCFDSFNIHDSEPCGWFSGQCVNCLPVHDHGTVAELNLLVHDLLGVSVGLDGHVAEAILALREQTKKIKDPDGVGVAHSVELLADELNISHQRASGEISGHLANWHSNHVYNQFCDILRILWL